MRRSSHPRSRRRSSSTSRENASRRVTAFPEFTDRERTILNLVAVGINNQAIASRLNLSVKTVRNHVSNIFTKLHVADRAEAIVRARVPCHLEAGF